MVLAERTRTTAQATAEGLRVFVAGIPWNVSEETLQRDFTECGLVEDLFLLRDAEGNSRGRCFVTFRDAKGVKAALEYDGTDYAGRTIYVKIANDKPKGLGAAKGQQEKKAKEESFPAAKPEGCVSLCLKNLGDATEADVRKLLKGCSIQAVRIVSDRATGASRGIAFVDFTASKEVDKAMEKNGTKLKGQEVHMHYEAPRSRPRPEGCLAVAVKKLGPETTAADIRKLFKGLNSLSDVRVICGKDKACTGLAFAEFTDVADVEAAVKRDGMAVQGQTVFICYETKSRKVRESGAAAAERAGAPAKKKGKPKRLALEEEAATEGAGEGAEEEQPQAGKKKKQAKNKQVEEMGADDAEVLPLCKTRKKRRKEVPAQEPPEAEGQPGEGGEEVQPEDRPRKKKRKRGGV